MMAYLNTLSTPVLAFILFALPLLLAAAVSIGLGELRKRRWRQREERSAKLRAQLVEGEFDRMVGH